MIDKSMERRVWRRIYPQPPKWRREWLRQCLRREEENFRYYDDLRMDEDYGPAFARLADDAMEHIKMLRQILGR